MKRVQDDRSLARKASKRRSYEAAFKRHLVELSLAPGSSVAKIALDHRLNANILFKWRRQHLRELARSAPEPAAGLLPVTVMEPERAAVGASVQVTNASSRRNRSALAAGGVIEIDLPLGRVRLTRGCGSGGLARGHRRAVAAMNPLPSGTRVWLAAGITDMRRGMDSLAAQVQTTLEHNPFSGHVFVFRGRRGDLVKLLWWSGDGLNLYLKRLERGRFVWPQADSGSVCSERGTVVDAARGHRLESAAAHLAAGARGVEFFAQPRCTHSERARATLRTHVISIGCATR